MSSGRVGALFAALLVETGNPVHRLYQLLFFYVLNRHGRVAGNGVSHGVFVTACCFVHHLLAFLTSQLRNNGLIQLALSG